MFKNSDSNFVPPLYCVIPKRNGGAYFSSSLECLIRQDIPFRKIIVSDDNSTDGSLEATRALNGSRNVEVVVPESPLGGMGANIAFALKRLGATEGYVVIGSVDDIWPKDFTKRLVERLNDFGPTKRKDVTAVFGDRYIIDKYGNRSSVTGSLKHPSVSSPSDVMYYAKSCRYIIHGAIFRLDMLQSLRNVLGACGQSADWIITIEAARVGSVIYLATPIFDYRIHSSSTTATRKGGHEAALSAYSQWLYKNKHTSPLINAAEVSNPTRANTATNEKLLSVKRIVQWNLVHFGGMRLLRRIAFR